MLGTTHPTRVMNLTQRSNPSKNNNSGGLLPRGLGIEPGALDILRTVIDCAMGEKLEVLVSSFS
jgi:hypothetical protein